MRRQVRVHPRRRATAQEQPTQVMPPTRAVADTSTAQDVINEIDRVLDQR